MTPNAYGPRTVWVGPHPYPPEPPKPPKPVKVVVPPMRIHTKFSYVLAIRSKPGISTTALTSLAAHQRRYVMRALAKLAEQRSIHCRKKPGSGKEGFWYPGNKS